MTNTDTAALLPCPFCKVRPAVEPWPGRELVRLVHKCGVVNIDRRHFPHHAAATYAKWNDEVAIALASPAVEAPLTDEEIIAAFWEQTGRDWTPDQWPKRHEGCGYFFSYGQLIDAVRALLRHQPAGAGSAARALEALTEWGLRDVQPSNAPEAPPAAHMVIWPTGDQMGPYICAPEMIKSMRANGFTVRPLAYADQPSTEAPVSAQPAPTDPLIDNTPVLFLSVQLSDADVHALHDFIVALTAPKVVAVSPEVTDELELRKLLATTYCPPHLLYFDDGELQDNREHPSIDFKRDSASEILANMRRRAALQTTKGGQGK